MTLRNIGRGLIATIAAVLLLCAPARGQIPPPPPPLPPDAPGQFDPAPPAPDVALATFNAVQEWVREWRTPMDPMGMARGYAAAVTLRYQGSIVGRGVAIAASSDGAPGIHVLATSRALAEAKGRMPIPHDALFDENLKAAAKDIAITLELAGRPIPLEIKEWADAINEVGPGLDGVAVRMGDKIEAMFPETMLVTGTDPSAGFGALVSKVSSDPALALKKPRELREQHKVVVYRFRVTTVGQPRLSTSPTFLHRGGRLVALSEIDTRELIRWADQLADHLIQSLVPAVGGSLSQGLYDPVRGQWSGHADLLEQLLIVRQLDGLPPVLGKERQRTGHDAALRTLEGVFSAAPGHGGIDGDPVAIGFCFSSMPWNAFTRAVPEDVWSFWKPRLTAAFSVERGFEPGVPAGAKAIIADGMTLADDSGPNPVKSFTEGLARPAIQRTFRDAGVAGLAAEMPWIGYADWYQSAREKIGTEGYDGRTVPIAGAAAFRQMRSQMWERQLRAEAIPPEAADLAGGILFTTSRQPLPTWQAVRPLAFVARMLGDPRLTDDAEVPQETMRLLESLRFLRQLTADEAECHMYKDPARAIGGVRNSLFDQRMPPEATAMTLLAVCETIKSLEAIKARNAAPKEASK